MDLEKFQAELTAELVEDFHREMFEKYGVTDKDIVRILERTRPQTGTPTPGLDVLIRYRSQDGAPCWAVARWNGKRWNTTRKPEAWYFLPESEE